MNYSNIQALPRDVADKIAAGEVVERPLSIVKELVENSIDADATAITVEIIKGGKEYIRVTDNGCGIPKDQLELAFMRYATSKLRTEEDLSDIETLGFRGEALASIAAVSKTELVSKTAGSRTGARISIAGSETISIEDAACEEGTTIIVKDLFYNVPARLKFLKPDNTESALVIDYVSKMAIAYPAVRMRLITNGSILFSTPGRNSLKTAVLTVYSQKTAQGMVQVAAEEGDMKIKGYVSSPTISEKNRRKQVFFVNGRLISSRVLENALADAYRDKLFEGCYPFCFIFLELDPKTLDVNIHPHKTEIRFYQEKQVFDFVVRSVRRALLDPAALEIKHQADDTLVKDSSRSEYTIVKPQSEVILPETSFREIPIQEKTTFESPFASVFRQIRQDEQKSDQVQEEIFDFSSDKRLSFSSLDYIGQAFATYLLFKDKDGLYIMDQHAAHERVMYEKLLGSFNGELSSSQQLLAPFILELGLSQMQASSEAADTLKNMGFELREFGPSSYAVSAVPDFMDLYEAEDFLREFFDAASETKTQVQARKDAITMRACKSAVKAHDLLSIDEVKRLLADLDKCENPYSCPHGRPTFLKYSEYELEKLFKRK